MRKIYKHQLKNTQETVELPFNAEILDIQEQGSHTCIWFIFDQDTMLLTKKEKIAVTVVCTGEDVPDDIGTYYKTVQKQGGTLIFHVFIKREVVG